MTPRLTIQFEEEKQNWCRKKRSRRYPAKTITDPDYADDIAILAKTPNQAETRLHSLERAAAVIGLHVNAHKTEYMCYNQTGDISTLDGTPLKLVDKFTYPTMHQLHGYLPPITKTIQVRRTRHAGHCWRSRDELISDVLLWTPTYGRAKAGRPARTYIQQLCQDTRCSPEDLLEAMKDREIGERGSGISVLAARHDDDDESFNHKL